MEINYDIKNIIKTKSDLVSLSRSELIEEYSDYEKNISFMDGIILITQQDGYFFFLDDDLIDKAQEIISIHIFSTDDKELIEIINEFTIILNKLKNLDPKEKEKLKATFIENEIMKRGIYANDPEFITECLYQDQVVLENLLEDREIVNKDDMLYIASLNYFAEVYPGLFTNPKLKEKAIKKLDEIGNKKIFISRKQKEFSREVKTYIKKIETKEE